jgi:hypothetical protein
MHSAKNQGRGVVQIFSKIPEEEGNSFRTKLLYYIFISKCFEICLGGPMSHPLTPLVCIYENILNLSLLLFRHRGLVDLEC